MELHLESALRIFTSSSEINLGGINVCSEVGQLAQIFVCV